MKKLTKGILTGAVACSFVFSLPFFGGCNEAEIQDLQNQVATLTSEKSALETENTGLKTEKTNLENQVSNLQREKSSLINDKNELNTENAALISTIDNLFKMAFNELSNKIADSTNADLNNDFKPQVMLYNSYIDRIIADNVIKLNDVYEIADKSGDEIITFRLKIEYKNDGSFWVYIKDGSEHAINAFNIKWYAAEFDEATYYEYNGEEADNFYIKYTQNTYRKEDMSPLEANGIKIISESIKAARVSDENKIVLEQD